MIFFAGKFAYKIENIRFSYGHEPAKNQFSRGEKKLDTLTESKYKSGLHQGSIAVEICEAQSEHGNLVCDFLQAHQEVSFCEWQGPAETTAMICRESSIVLLAFCDGILAGVLCGGVMGSRATINHMAVDPLFRQLGIGSRLLKHSEQLIREKGIRRMFLFVDANNQLGVNFWERKGFNRTYGELTLEKDI